MSFKYEQQLEDIIARQKEEITRLLAENQKLKGLNDTIYEETAEQARVTGQQEAWKLAKNIVLFENDDGYSMDELNEIFDSPYLSEIFNLTYSEAAAKVVEWEQKKEEICMGDVLLSNRTDNKCIVTRIGCELITVLWGDGSCSNKTKNSIKEGFKKIGHIDVNAWMAQIGGESE